MRKLFTSLAVFIALGSALPTFAGDVTADRYSPYRGERAQDRRALNQAAPDAGLVSETKKAPCSCACMRVGDHAEASHTQHGGR
jgi:hypothetical protein